MIFPTIKEVKIVTESNLLEQSVTIENILNRYNSYCVLKWVCGGEFGMVFKVGSMPIINISFTKGVYKVDLTKKQLEFSTSMFNTFEELIEYLNSLDFKNLMGGLKELYVKLGQYFNQFCSWSLILFLSLCLSFSSRLCFLYRWGRVSRGN